MIHPDTRVQYLDIKDGEPRYKTIEKLYQEYTHKSKIIIKDNECEISEINFANDPHVKITDLFGWTDIIKIRKTIINADYYIWNDIRLCNNNVILNKHVIVDYDELIPCYDINQHRVGFHGEVKYKYTLKSPTKMTKGDYLRIRNCEDENEEQIEFASCHDLVAIGDHQSGGTTGFSIVTKSRFFNGNDIHLFASDEITIDEISKWYK
jgi:hypothetical protein